MRGVVQCQRHRNVGGRFVADLTASLSATGRRRLVDGLEAVDWGIWVSASILEYYPRYIAVAAGRQMLDPAKSSQHGAGQPCGRLLPFPALLVGLDAAVCWTYRGPGPERLETWTTCVYICLFFGPRLLRSPGRDGMPAIPCSGAVARDRKRGRATERTMRQDGQRTWHVLDVTCQMV